MTVPGAVIRPDQLVTEYVTFPSGNATIRAYLAQPRASGPFPAVIVIHEVFGLNDHIEDVTRRFAAQGFLALAPNLYSRDSSFDAKDPDAPKPNGADLPDEQIVQDLEQSAAFLRLQSTSTNRVGCIGFCSGGRQTLLLACRSTQVDAAVDCWGGFITRASATELTTPNRPVPVIELVDALHCPLYGVFGAEDQNPSPDDARLLERRLRAAGKLATIEIFQNAGHAFFADYRPHYREQAAHDLWPKVLDFFRRHLQ